MFGDRYEFLASSPSRLTIVRTFIRLRWKVMSSRSWLFNLRLEKLKSYEITSNYIMPRFTRSLNKLKQPVIHTCWEYIIFSDCGSEGSEHTRTGMFFEHVKNICEKCVCASICAQNSCVDTFLIPVPMREKETIRERSFFFLCKYFVSAKQLISHEALIKQVYYSVQYLKRDDIFLRVNCKNYKAFSLCHRRTKHFKFYIRLNGGLTIFKSIL